MLRRELQHRTKNNLSLIIALLGREQRIATAEQDERAAGRLGALIQRVSAIAVAQDWLSLSGDDGQEIDLAVYLRVLVEKIQLTFGDSLQLKADLSQCILPFSKAVAAGLLVNELITNSAKHAYPEERGGLVRLVLRIDEEGREAVLTVSDEGQGIDVAAVAARVAEGGQGMTLVELLSKQLGGHVVHQMPEHGTRTTIRFACVT
ncbi:sensor histidine kinase [Muricoccus aerilatus]|uniref:sensor histidine kinase n=1 Tax=Muricoccus aerilatus TaxID=452982 RepID=UPI00146FE00A|nr:sensor histidine kinase [Roseomonas aerilata]